MLLGFRGEFESSLRNGISQMQGLPLRHKGAMVKRQTIRPWRGTLPPVGEPLFLWARLRHKTLPPIKIGEVECRRAELIKIPLGGVGQYYRIVWVGMKRLEAQEAHDLAILEGCRDIDALARSFERRGRHRRRSDGPFLGILIQW